MRTTTPVLFALALVVAACGVERADTDDSMTAMPEPAAQTTPPMTRNLTLASMNNSGATASVTLAAVGDSTSVAVNLDGAAANSTLPEHIHAGTCEAPGPVVVPLDPLTTDASGAAMASTIVGVPMRTVANGQHYVQVHGPDGNPIACGNITASAGTM